MKLLVIIIGCINIIILFVLLFIKLYDDIFNPCLSCKYDGGDWILDTKTGEYLHLEEACTRLNEVTEDCTKMAQAYNDFIQMIKEATSK